MACVLTQDSKSLFSLNGTNYPKSFGLGGPVYASNSKFSRIRRDHQVVPLSSWEPACHPLVESVTQEVDSWFLDNWNFPDEKARRKFVAAGFSRVTCLYFPLAKDDRIQFACRLLAILFLIDGVFAHAAGPGATFAPVEKKNGSLTFGC